MIDVYKTILLSELVHMSEEEYLLYKLCVFYYAKTELYDRELTDLRSQHDPTEACVPGRWKTYSNRYALNMRRFIYEIANKLNLGKRKLSDFKHYRYSAQGWIDEYNRLEQEGEFSFVWNEHRRY